MEADRLAMGRRVRTVAPLPGSLLPEDPRDNEHYGELMDGVTAPHWNSAVDTLRSGPQGYLALLQMRDRLDERLDRERRVYERAEVTRSVAARVGRIVRAEANRHGASTMMYVSLRDSGGGTSDWEWAPEDAVVDFIPLPRPVDMPDQYRLVDAEVTELLERYSTLRERDSVPFPRALLSFNPEDTWDDCERIVAGRTWSWKPGATEKWRERRVELIEFRLSVVEQVLSEHEVLGYVGEYGESPRPVELDEEQEEFLKAALRAFELVDKRKLEPTWFAIQGKLAEWTGRSRNQLERIAEKRFDAFEKGSGSGRPSAQDVEERYSLFRRQTERWARSSGIGSASEDR